MAINASQAQGRVSYDAKQSGTCIDSLNAMTCDEFKQGVGGNMAACMAFIMPKVAQGGACTQDYECTTGNCEGAIDRPARRRHVRGGAGSGGHRPVLRGQRLRRRRLLRFSTDTCQPLKGAGEACTSDNECINTCNTTTNTCSCYSGCAVAGPTTTQGTLLSLLLVSAGLVFTRTRRRRR